MSTIGHTLIWSWQEVSPIVTVHYGVLMAVLIADTVTTTISCGETCMEKVFWEEPVLKWVKMSDSLIYLKNVLWQNEILTRPWALNIRTMRQEHFIDVLRKQQRTLLVMGTIRKPEFWVWFLQNLRQILVAQVQEGHMATVDCHFYTGGVNMIKVMKLYYKMPIGGDIQTLIWGMPKYTLRACGIVTVEDRSPDFMLT
jgi:hypothetical protein